MDSHNSNSVLPADTVDVLMPNDLDPMDDNYQLEESHYRRSSFNQDDAHDSNGDNRNRRDSRDRGVLDDRRESRGRSRSPIRARDYSGGSRNDRDDKHDTDRRPSQHDNDRGGRGRSRSRSPGRSSSGSSLRDRRVYVGNLSYDVKWTNLKDFMRQ
ncbi:hypothetical protein BGZ54_008557, partial [Gamsiella multidivaricata]